jgi:hypothetical protein
MIANGCALHLSFSSGEKGMRQATPPRISSQIRGDAIEGISAMGFGIVRGGGAEEAVVGLLEQVIG